MKGNISTSITTLDIYNTGTKIYLWNVKDAVEIELRLILKPLVRWKKLVDMEAGNDHYKVKTLIYARYPWIYSLIWFGIQA